MDEANDIARGAGGLFSSAAATSFEDAGARRLRYHLLRLTTAGLSRTDVEDLVELGRLAFQDSDVTDQATKIQQRSDVSSLAFAIADIVQTAANAGRGGSKAVMLGAVLGAYASLTHVPAVDESFAGTLGAIGGAVAMSTSTFITDNITSQSWSEYVNMVN